jgi:23S rRNA (pseudouridine1915-N3)-methyltransferase
MGFLVLTVGKPRAPWVEAAVETYRGRTPEPWHWAWEWVDAGAGGSQDPATVLGREGDRLLRRLTAADRVVALDVAGRALDSPALAERCQAWLEEGGRTVFVIGGSFGLSEAVKARAQWRWSLSPLTLAHDVAVVVVAEQLYRAWAIRHGHPYHK